MSDFRVDDEKICVTMYLKSEPGTYVLKQVQRKLDKLERPFWEYPPQ